MGRSRLNMLQAAGWSPVGNRGLSCPTPLSEVVGVRGPELLTTSSFPRTKQVLCQDYRIHLQSQPDVPAICFKLRPFISNCLFSDSLVSAQSLEDCGAFGLWHFLLSRSFFMLFSAGVHVTLTPPPPPPH